ncbi:ABC transporter ATP-binding protein [Amycolatopsis sp. NPDC021455]|uniref:ABC transporter ATP-binding protein n=1 Tax=Amycolatopsis sp. NPDC021455 TaxID=3154901 RepID=UPI0033D8919D
MLIPLLTAHVRPHRRAVAVVALVQLVQTIAALALPDLSADIIDNGVLPGNTGHIWFAGSLMTVAALVQLACGIAAARLGARIATGLAADLRGAQVERIQAFSTRELTSFGAPSLITRVTNDVQQIQTLVQTVLTFMVTAPLMCAGGIVFAVAQDRRLSLLLMVIAPVLATVTWLVTRRMVPASRVLQTTIDTVNRVLREQITGLRVIRAFGREDQEHARFAAANERLTGVSLGIGKLMALIVPAVTAVAGVSGVAVVWFGAQRVDSGAIGPGALTAFLGYLLQILGAAIMATYLLRQLPRAQVSARRVAEVLNTESSLAPPAQPVRTLPRPGRVEFRDVSFRYPGAEAAVLDDVAFTAEPGRTTALIGSTGSGKSTTLSLIPRLADPSGGAVLVGGVDVRRLDPAVLARTVAYVPQRPYLFSGTIATNLRLGRSDASDEELWWALETAQAAEFVTALPLGLDTPVAQGGTTFSGGQRQRLAIARALAVRPAVYLFDDSFSALDQVTDARLRAALATETAGATVVVVAQRVATIRHADRIVVLDEGRVAGQGTHRHLMAECPVYREIVLSQPGEAEAA